MVVVIAAAAVAAGVGAYKGGKMAVAGVKKKVEDRKKSMHLKQREKEYENQKQQLESERIERLNSISAMRSRTSSRVDDSIHQTESFKERLANYKTSIKGAAASTISRLKRKGTQD